MEISNRESTYNRVFSDKRQLVVDKKKGSVTDASNSVSDAADTIMTRLSREKALQTSIRQSEIDKVGDHVTIYYHVLYYINKY
jgi:hypothetical protein